MYLIHCYPELIMIKRNAILSLPFYKKNPFTGSYQGMRYRIAKVTEDEKDVLRAFTYPEPFSFEKTADELKTHADFEFSDEGLDKACEWLNTQYEENIDKWREK